MAMPTKLHTAGYIDNTKPHVMLDLETLACTPNACIKSISLATMFPDDHIELFNAWLMEDSQWGGDVSLDTIAFWKDLYTTFPILEDVEMAATKHKAVDVLNTLDRYLSEPCFANGYYLWSNGADFDIPILRALWARASVHLDCKTPELPNLHYKKPRCFRTTRATFLEVKQEWEDIIINDLHKSLPPHFSLVDALRQLLFIALLTARSEAFNNIFSLLLNNEFLKGFMVQSAIQQEIHNV